MQNSTTSAGLNLASKLYAMGEQEFEEHAVELDYESREWLYNLIQQRTNGLPNSRSDEMAPEDPLRASVQMAEVAVKLFTMAVISYVGVGGKLESPGFMEIKRLLCSLFPFYCDEDE